MNLRPLRQRNFGLLWWAGLISITGNWVLNIALPIYVLKLTGSPAAVSAVVSGALVASLLFGSFAGAYVDRWDRRRVVVLVNLLQMLAVLPLVLVDRPGRVWIVVVVAFGESALSQFFQPAENALLPSLVTGDNLAAANALNSLNNNIGRLLGPAVGGLAAVAFGLSGAALLDAASFAIAAGLCALITGTHRADRTGEPHRHLVRELIEGLKALGRNRIVRSIFALVMISSVGEGMMATLFAFYVVDAMRADGRAMGWMMSAQAVGGIAGGLIATRFVNRFRPVPLITASYTVFGLIDIAIFNYPRFDTTLWPVIAMFALVGLPTGIHISAIWTLFQISTPDRLRGRLFSAIWVGAALAGMVGAALAGSLGGRVNIITLLTVQGAGPIVAALIFRLIAGRGPDSLAVPAEPSDVDGTPAAREATTMPA
jgi:MFS family permease